MVTALLAGTLTVGSGVCLVVAGWYFLAGSRSPMQRRVQAFVKQPERAAVDLAGGRRGRGTTRVASGPESSNPVFRRLERAALSAKADIRPLEVIGIGAGFGALFGITIVLATGIWILVVPAVLIGFYVPIYWLRLRTKRIAKRFHAQLADTVGLLASAVRAGNALPRAFERISTDSPEPTKSAFEVAVREMGHGAALEDTLDRLAARFPSEEMDLLVASVNVQYQVGGNLTKVLDLIADTLRERIRIKGDIRSLTASQRGSAYLLSALPVVVAVFLFFVSPSYIGILFEGAFRIIPAIAASLIILGFLVMMQLAKVDV